MGAMLMHGAFLTLLTFVVGWLAIAGTKAAARSWNRASPNHPFDESGIVADRGFVIGMALSGLLAMLAWAVSPARAWQVEGAVGVVIVVSGALAIIDWRWKFLPDPLMVLLLLATVPLNPMTGGDWGLALAMAVGVVAVALLVTAVGLFTIPLADLVTFAVPALILGPTMWAAACLMATTIGALAALKVGPPVARDLDHLYASGQAVVPLGASLYPALIGVLLVKGFMQ